MPAKRANARLSAQSGEGERYVKTKKAAPTSVSTALYAFRAPDANRANTVKYTMSVSRFPRLESRG